MTLRSQVSLVLLMILSGSGDVAQGRSKPEKLTTQDSRLLVYEIVKAENPGADVRRISNRYDHDFYYFEVIVSNDVASPVVGHYAVNPWTGDVWNPALCTRVTSPSIERIQERIRSRLNLPAKDYSSLRARKPLCS